MPKTDKQTIGSAGEDSACKYLENKGFSIIERNYWKKFGEIDIVSERDGIIHFVEVKSVSRETNFNVTHEKYQDYEPTDNIHYKKLERLHRVIQIYLEDRNVSDETDWQIDVISVFLNFKTRKAHIEHLEDI